MKVRLVVAAYSRAVDSLPEVKPRSVEANLVLVCEAIERQRSWIDRYTKFKIGYSASPNDFTDILERRLLNRMGTQEGDAGFWDAAVRNMFKLLVHEERRSIFREGQKLVSTAEIGEVQDPNSLEFQSRLELESEARLTRERVRLIRERIPADLLPVIDSLYGFVDEETVSVADIAKRLGIRKNTLSQRLHRLYVNLRAEFR